MKDYVEAIKYMCIDFLHDAKEWLPLFLKITVIGIVFWDLIFGIMYFYDKSSNNFYKSLEDNLVGGVVLGLCTVPFLAFGYYFLYCFGYTLRTFPKDTFRFFNRNADRWDKFLTKKNIQAEYLRYSGKYGYIVFLSALILIIIFLYFFGFSMLFPEDVVLPDEQYKEILKALIYCSIPMWWTFVRHCKIRVEKKRNPENRKYDFYEEIMY